MERFYTDLKLKEIDDWLDLIALCLSHGTVAASLAGKDHTQNNLPFQEKNVLTCIFYNDVAALYVAW